ncbi:MAG: YjgF/chorismate mutase-like, putative endoribonuclease, partial [Pseudomonadota bacterium]
MILIHFWRFMSFEKRLQELGLEIPALPQPVANYVPGLEAQGLLYISGQGPRNSEGQ